jgi:hypothetical protein
LPAKTRTVVILTVLAAAATSIAIASSPQNWLSGTPPEEVIPRAKPASEYFERVKVTDLPDSSYDDKPAVTVAAMLHDNGFFGLVELWTLNDFEDELEKPLLALQCGRWSGHESGGGERTIFYLGTDAEKMFRAMIPRLKRHEWASGSYVLLNYGKPTFQKWRIPLPLKRIDSTKETRGTATQ